MTTVLPIARVAGVEIRVHFSWALLVGLVTMTVAVWLLAIYPDWTPMLAWVTGAVVAVLAFGSVALHELAHAVVARRRHVPTDTVTLYIFGSSAGFDGDAGNPAADAAIAVAGPLASFVLGMAAFLVWRVTALALEPVLSAVAVGAFLIGAFNLLIALVNLVPGFPLDGGRILRAVVWRLTGSERRGTRAAITIGRTIGLIGVMAGLVVALVAATPEGMVTMLGGWLLTNSARVLERQMLIQDLTAGMHVEDAMEREGLTVPGGLTLDTFAAEAIEQTPGAAVRVAGEGAVAGGIVGIIGNNKLRRTPRRRWPNLRARDLMTATASLPSLRTDDALWTALERLQRSRQEALPVFDGEVLAGLATRRSVSMAVREAVERSASAGGGTGPRGLAGLAGRWAGRRGRSGDGGPQR